MGQTNALAGSPPSRSKFSPVSWTQESVALLRLAFPLIIAQLAGILLFTTDVVMMGWLGPEYLAAGSLATALMHPLAIGGMGLIMATAPLIAQAKGARRYRDVRRVARQGLWVSFFLSFFTVPILLFASPIFLAMGQIPSVVADTQTYLNIAAFALPPSFAIIVYRSVLQAHDKTNVVLAISILGVLLNALSNYTFMFGNFGMPRLELAGAAISTVLVNCVMMIIGIGYVVLHKSTRRYHILVRFFKPDWQRFVTILTLGTPIGLTLLSEVGLFGAAVVMMGWISADAVAGHAIAMQVAAISFMVPLGFSMATTVRVGLHFGAGNLDGVHKSGWASLVITLMIMVLTCTLFITNPNFFVGIFLDANDPAAAPAAALAASFVVVAGVFQLVDGAQVSSTASLRGLSDTRVPMIVALIGYWVFGFGTAYWLGFILGWGGVGIWWGLATGLGINAVVLFIRFVMRERLGLLKLKY